MNIIPSKPTLWVRKDNFVTKILKDQWAKWGASSVCFLIKNLPPKDFTVTLVNDKKIKIDTDDFQVHFEKEEKNDLGHTNMKLYTYNGTQVIPNTELELFLKVQINFCSSKYDHTVLHVEVSCDGKKSWTPPFYVASRARGIGDQPKLMCISLNEINTLRKPKVDSRKKTLWEKKRKRKETSSEEDTDTDSDTDTERETYVNTKEIKKDTTAIRKEVSELRKENCELRKEVSESRKENCELRKEIMKTNERLQEVIDHLLTQQQETEDGEEGEEGEEEGEEEEEDEDISANNQSDLFNPDILDNMEDSDAKHVYESFRNNTTILDDGKSIDTTQINPLF